MTTSKKLAVKFGTFDCDSKSGNGGTLEILRDGECVGTINRDIEDANFRSSSYARRYVVTGYYVEIDSDVLTAEPHDFDTLPEAKAFARAILAPDTAEGI